MKAFKWFIFLLVLGTALWLFVRPTSTGMPDPSPAQGEMTSVRATGPTEAASAPPAVQEVREEGHHLQVIVLNEQGQALEKASVATSIRVEPGNNPLTNFNRTFSTSSQGIADVLWPTQKLDHLELVISKDDYAPQKMAWDLKTGDEIPPAYTVKLKSGVQVGGFVVDPEGVPVAAATVSLSRFWRGGEERLNKGEETTFLSQKHVTGFDGRWTAHSLPPELLNRMYVIATHTNFITVMAQVDGKPEIEQELRAGTYKLQLKRGLEVHGRVLNELQLPIAGAQVWSGRKYAQARKQTTSDELGRFTFHNVEGGKGDFSVAAEGYAPAVKTHNVDAAAAELVFQLVKGSIIRGIVQDESSQPIAGVRVSLDGSLGEDSRDRYEFSATTGSDGRFEWKSAPNAPAPFYFGKLGYEQRRGVRLKPVEENVITLRRNRQLEGVVLDAETEKPVTNFTIAVGRYQGKNQFSAGTGSTKEFKSNQGLFTIELHEENDNGIQATARGYSEQIQTLPQAENRQLKIVFKLAPSQTLTGIVVTAEGQPVPGAHVALVDGVPGGRSVQFARGQLRSTSSRTRIITTDSSGRFEIVSPPATGNIVAANGAGYGSATLAEVKASGVLALQPFGRIEGQLLQGAMPMAGQELTLSFPGSGVSFEFQSTLQTTDAEGRFTFENVPAVQVRISRLVKTSSSSRSYSHRTDVMVLPGQTTQVTLGGANATLRGQVRFETAPPGAEYVLSAQLSTVRPLIPEGLTPEQRTAFLNSEERKTQLKNMKYYTAAVGLDGSLVLDSIAPGQYTLNVTAKNPNDPGPGGKPLASGATTVTIPEGAQPGTPITVGEILLKLTK